MPHIFPDYLTKNLCLMVTGIGAKNGLSVFLVNQPPDLNLLEAGAQCFPLKIYGEGDSGGNLFSSQNEQNYSVSSGITNLGFECFQNAYSGDSFTKEDLFYYIYGLLHSPEYRERFQNNLSKELPRIPAVKKFEEFMAFSEAGRELGDLHVNYESVEPYPVTIKEGDLQLAHIPDPKEFYSVKKMKFAGTRGSQDKTNVIYNSNITMQDIPLEAYEYVVNGKSALDWVMDRQVVKTDKASGITNDANDYANETVNNPAYPLELFQRVITVSLETMKIVRSLPKLDI
jgi:predicted helicase